MYWSEHTPVFSTNKTDCYDIAEILLKVAFNAILLNLTLECVQLHSCIEYTAPERDSIDNVSGDIHHSCQCSGMLTPLPGYRDSCSILRNFRISQETI
jgi:hypothetical protein